MFVYDVTNKKKTLQILNLTLFNLIQFIFIIFGKFIIFIRKVIQLVKQFCLMFDNKNVILYIV